MNLRYITNPISVLPDKVLLLLSIFTFGLGTAIAYYTQMIYDGIIDVHVSPYITFIKAFASNAVNVVVLTLALLLFGKIINKKTRVIDLLNTSFLSRIPIYILTLIINIPFVVDVNKKIVDQLDKIPNLDLHPSEIGTLIAVSLISIIVFVYVILLILNGFKTATNAKKPIHYLYFAMAFIIAEVIAKLITQFL